MFCGECGKLIKEGNKFCTGCGTKVEPISTLNKSTNNVKEEEEKVVKNKTKVTEPVNEEKKVEVTSNTESVASNNNVSSNNTSYVKENNDKVSVWFNILAFLIPIVGLILFITMKNDTPKRAKFIGISALVGYIFSMIGSIILCIYIYGFVLPNMNIKYNTYPRYNRNFNFEINRDYNI